MEIPKIFMQTWKTKDIPKKWRKSPKSIKKYMPHWKYVLMTDKDNKKFVKQYFPDFYRTFREFPYDIQRADAIRYMFLYVNGGIYMDLDFYLKRNLEDLIYSDNLHFVKYESVAGLMYTNSIMISPQKHPFWLKVIKEMKNPVPFWCVIRSQIVYESTGPYMLSRVIRKKLEKKKTLKLEKLIDDYLVVLEGRSWHGPIENFGTMITDIYNNI